MPALNFKKQFVDLVLSGEKRQTIRPTSKRKFKIGDTLYLYTGMRTKQCKKIGEAICTNVIPVEIMFMDESFLFLNYGKWGIYMYEDYTIHNDKVAIQDGFDTTDPEGDFTKFFIDTYGLGFADCLDLQIIRWGQLNEN